MNADVSISDFAVDFLKSLIRSRGQTPTTLDPMFTTTNLSASQITPSSTCQTSTFVKHIKSQDQAEITLTTVNQLGGEFFRTILTPLSKTKLIDITHTGS